MVYVFFVGGARYGGTMNSHDPVNATHQGEPLWVVYRPNHGVAAHRVRPAQGLRTTR
ncbi:MAG: hypothetical protein IPL19_08510 [Sandaracinaceae bacterium]|nr:hypothetical protein [Sandaracinaceae bacterium]